MATKPFQARSTWTIEMAVYYNEIDPFAAAWLRKLISAGQLPAGDVDTRSIEDVIPTDLEPYSQHHFFAGIGGWPLALKLAGWPADKPVWTGSTPCQPFSAAGKGKGADDERHLWPAFFWLIQQCRPTVIFGERVASKVALKWWDLVADDLEGENYAAATFDLPASSVGAPHRRQRLFWVAYANCQRQQKQWQSISDAAKVTGSQQPGEALWLANAQSFEGRPGDGRNDAFGKAEEWGICSSRAGQRGTASNLADTQGTERKRLGNSRARRHGFADDGKASPWTNSAWIEGLDGKVRPTKPGLCLLADGVPGRVGRLRGYGNAVVPQLAAVFIESFM
ncbi:MAG: DNA cytosine methyltransferase [Phormidesmis sp.]